MRHRCNNSKVLNETVREILSIVPLVCPILDEDGQTSGTIIKSTLLPQALAHALYTPHPRS
jgi:hypothetical protein